ncbi:ricin B lectin-like protein [Phytophthora cinnamomi]|uniref:ricin B lectin-like protein n=1 Tax=Phytophthora cinnamomi TaxID=4785 RepID=UPI00355953B7|nr:ricin B lectin-like protein [Phytophthora cinnamomi]
MSRPIRHQLRYMNEIRDFIRSSGKNTSVTITDTIDLYNANPQLLKAVDYVSVNYSPFWERVDVNEGVAATLDSLRGLRKTAANKDKSVVVSETGWSSGGTNPVPGMASPANQAKYFSDFVLMAHSHKDLNDYWSDAFDANWLNEKVVEAHLGVYLKAGQMKDDIFKLENNWRVPRLIRTEGSIMLSEYIGELYMSEKSNEWLTQEQQTWFFDSTTQQIRSKSSDRCLDAYQPWDGGKVHVYRCMDNEPNQKWTYDNATSTLQYATHKGFCLDHDSAQNNKVQLYGCSTNNMHQKWEVIDPDTLYCQVGSFCNPNEQ